MSYNIKHYLQAGYPLLWKQEQDSFRFLKELEVIANEGKTKKSGPMDLYVWDLVNGLSHYHKNELKTEIANEKNFDKFLDSVLKKMKDEKTKNEDNSKLYKNSDKHRPSMIVLLNIETVINNNIRAQQMFKEFAHYGKEFEQHVICVSTTLNYPASIEKDLAVIPYEYPTDSLIESILVSLSPGTFEKDEILKTKLVQASKGLTLTEAENAFSLAMVEHKGFNSEAVQTVQQLKTQFLGNKGILTYIPPTLNMNDVAGLENLKEWLAVRKQSLFNQKAKDFGLKEPKGVLIAGVPGGGKSLTAKAIASSWELPLLHFDISQVFGGLVGQSERQMKETLATIESVSPCILWLDEVEKAFAGVGGSGDSGATTRVFGQFLTWMQEKKSTVFVVATANDVQNLPSAFIRKGRFDEFFFVDLPNESERKAILELHLTKANRKPSNYNLSVLVNETNGFTGAELEEVINTGLYQAFYENNELKDNHLLDAIANTTPISVTMKEDIESLRSWAKERARNASNEETLVKLDDIKSKTEKTNRPIVYD